MTAYIALLKAVNIGGTGRLPMADLVKLCEEAGFKKVKTYIASGNAIFTSPKSAKQVESVLEQKVEEYFGKPVPVMVRTVAELETALKASPFHEMPGNKAAICFLDAPPPEDLFAGARHQTNEEAVAGKREIYLYYPDGAGQSKFVLPAARKGTARNMNTINKLVELASAL